MSQNDQKQSGVISGSVFDAPLHDTSVKTLKGEIPRVGREVEFEDGRKYVFVASYNDDFVAGEILGVGDAIKTEMTDILTAASAGSKTLIVDITGETIFGNSAALAKDRMAGGYIIISNGTGEGYSYRVKSNSVQDGDDKVTFLLYDALIVAVDTSTDIHMVGPKYHGVIKGTETTTPVGVTLRATLSGTNTRWEYHWVQTQGLAAVLVKTASGVAAGEVVCLGADGGLVVPGDAGITPIIGQVASVPTADGDTCAVWLNIA